MNRNVQYWFIIFIVLLPFTQALSQRQLILMSGDKLLFRFKEGSKFHSRLTGQKQEHWGFLVEINEFSVITSQDTIQLKKIRKVLLPGKPFVHKMGKTLLTVGAGLFVMDQINNSVILKNKPSLEAKIWIPSVIMLSTGLPLLLVNKNWKKVGRGVRLISVGRDSRFYLAE